MTGCNQPLSEPATKTPPLNSISGHVYDERDGAPIKNALVQVEQTGILNPPGMPVEAGSPVPVLPVYNPLRVEGKTTADGSYAITDLPSGYYYSVTVTAARYNKYLERIVVADNSSITKDFTLYKVSSISGHVYRAEDGKPLAGAEIQVWPAFVSPYRATTAADSSYTVDALRDGLWTVRAGAPGYVPKTYDGATGTYDWEITFGVATQYGADTPNIDFILERGGSITGQIYEPDGVTPAKGTLVTYVQTSGIKTPELFKTDLPQPYPPSVEADASGRYTLAALLTGTYELQAVRYTDGATSSTAQVSVVIGQNTIQDFILGK